MSETHDAGLRPGAAGRGYSASKMIRVARQRGDFRTEEQLREHYRVERQIADRLRQASAGERRVLYSESYDEMFRRVPHHPMLKQAGLAQQRNIEPDLKLLRRFLTRETVFMEIGAGDCALAIRAAASVKQVYAIDVSEEITRDLAPPGNFKLILSDGTSIPVPAGSVNVAFSDQLMEHLHPDDAKEQLHNIYRSLAPGGIYVCITPNRLYGPRDISEYFDEVATGFHLREYSGRELRGLFAGAGFARVHFLVGARGWFLRCPVWLISGIERALDALPYALRKPLADTAPMRALLGVRIVAIKHSAM